MVKFIGGGIKKNDEDGDGGFAPAPGARIAPDGFANGAPEEDGEHGVFSEVRAFAKHMMDHLDVRLSHMREEPVQERLNEPGRVGVGFGIA